MSERGFLIGISKGSLILDDMLMFSGDSVLHVSLERIRTRSVAVGLESGARFQQFNIT